MIGIKDDELLNFLMTSDYNDVFTPDEYKFLLAKWRYFYRVQNSKNEQLQHKISELELKIKEIENDNKNIVCDLNKSLDSANIKIFNLENRKLSIKERLKGKIIKSNEN